MKTFKLFMTFAIMVMSFGMTACDNDDDKDKEKGGSSSIIGVWHSEEEEDYFIFDEDGSGVYFSEYEDDDMEFTYKLKGNKLTIRELDGYSYTVTVQVSKNKLKITEDGVSVTYTRVDIDDIE